MLFRDARLKIDRANKHIEEIETFISLLPSAYTSTIEINPSAGNEVIKHDLSNRDQLVSDIALMIGDAIHNLKCALDYAWVETVGKIAPTCLNGNSKFPIFASKEKLKQALSGAKIKTSSRELYRLIVVEVKSYEGGNDPLWAIHRLDIDDKHRLLTPVLEYVGIERIKVKNERGETHGGFGIGTSAKPPYYVPIESGWHVEDKGEIALSITFGKETKLYGMDVPSMLRSFSIVALSIVQLLENLCF